jgi:Protein of unknown function (DUF4435)
MSLLDSKTSSSVVAEILMLKTTHNGGFFLVEGEDDSLFWSSRIFRSTCQIVICGGKVKVIEAAIKLDALSERMVLGYVDCDFDRARCFALQSPRLSHTDTHDLETMMLNCLALDKVLVEIADPEKLKEFEKINATSIFQAVLDRGIFFGRLRLLNDIRSCGVNFKEKLSPYKYFDQTGWQLDINKLENDFCIEAGIQPYILQPALSSLPNANPLDLIQGHDALCILAIGLKGPLGGRKSFSEKEIASRLRIAMESQHLINTNLFINLKSYENNLGLSLFSV